MARARRISEPLSRSLLPLLLVAVAATALMVAVRAVRIEIINHCSGGAMKLFDGGNVTRLKENSTVVFDLPANSIRAYRYDTISQATLAEFSVDPGNKTWYDISIIPTGPKSGPQHCKSLAECKSLTGGVGFNKPLMILPKVNYPDENCRKLVCLRDGCDDAYQFPQQDEKTHTCISGVDFQVVFCPTPLDAELDWIDPESALERGVIVGDAAAARATTEPPVAAESDVLTRSVAVDDSSSALYVASALGGTLLVIVLVAAVLRYRQRVVANVQYHWPDRKSSDAVSFVSARDVL